MSESKKSCRIVISAALIILGFQASMVHAAFVDYQSTIVVSPVGPTAGDNGTALLAALDSIATGIPGPSETNRFLLKVEPGIYDVGLTAVVLPPYVDMEGSGEGVTLITGDVQGALPASQGLVTVGTNAEIRYFTVTNIADGEAIDSASVLLLSGASAKHITAVATGSSTINRALMAGLSEGDIAPNVSAITAKADTRAVQVFFPGLVADNVVATGTQGLLVSSGNVVVRNSQFTGSDFSMLVANLSETVDMITTQLSGDISCTSKNCRCFASYDAKLKPLKRKCKSKK